MHRLMIRRPFGRRVTRGSGRWGYLAGAVVLAAAMAPAAASSSAEAGRAARAVPAAGVATGIDGFAPFLHTTNPGHGSVPQAWVIAHHGYTSMSAPRISCVNVATGGFCPDANGNPTTWPKPLNLAAGALGSGSTGNLATTEIPQIAQDPDPNRVRYPVVTTTAVTGFPNGSVGVGCLDMESQANCTYEPLAALTNTTGQSNVNGLTGFVVVGSKAYGTLTNGKELCFDLSSSEPCSGQPFTTNTPPNNDKAGLGVRDFIGTTAVVGGKIYITSNGTETARNTSPHPPTLSCFDPSTNTSCSSFTPKTITNANALWALAILPDLNASGTAIGVCVVTGNKTTAAPIVSCYDFNGNAIAAPPGLAGLFPTGGTQSVVFQPLTTTVSGDERSYLPFFTQSAAHPGATLCYSWTHQAPCAGFPNPLTHPAVNGGLTHDYGYAYSSARTCVFGSGDPGYMFSFNPTTGTGGC